MKTFLPSSFWIKVFSLFTVIRGYNIVVLIIAQYLTSSYILAPNTGLLNVIFDSNNQVLKIGKIGTQKEEVHGEFIGMIKLTDRGTELLKENFHRVKKIYWNKPFQRASIFQKAYLTDMLQELVDVGIKVHCVIIERGWKEIDTIEDYQKAIREFNE